MKKKPIKVEDDGAFNEEWTESFGSGTSAFRPREADKKRQLGTPVSTEDLLSVVFSLRAEFDVSSKEIVVVPRSRGGFVYAAVTERIITDKCSFDPEVSHSSIRYRVTYPGGLKPSKGSKSQQQQQQLTKYLPPFFIGKLPRRISPEIVKVASDMDKVTQGLTSIQIEKLPRKVGERILKCDLLNACFSPVSSFEVGQMVAVPRSFGGFTYGRVLEPHRTKCIINKTTTHDIDGWRVVMNERSATNPHMNYKDLPVAVIGRLFLISNIPNPVQPTIERPQKQEELVVVEEEFYKELEKEMESEKKTESVAHQELRKESVYTDDGFDEEDEDDEFFKYVMQNDRSMMLNTDLSDDFKEKSPYETKVPHSLPQKTQPQTLAKPLQPKGQGLINVSKQTFAKATEQKVDIGNALVVIDAPNVGRHEDKMVLKVKLLKSAIDYYMGKGCDVVAFLPRYFMEKRQPSESNPTVETYAEMDTLVKNGTVSLTPPQDYDDSYCIEYARKHKGVIVTNDMYRDHIEKRRSQDKTVYHWIKTHCISYTFVRGEFIPNPDFNWEKV